MKHFCDATMRARGSFELIKRCWRLSIFWALGFSLAIVQCLMFVESYCISPRFKHLLTELRRNDRSARRVGAHVEEEEDEEEWDLDSVSDAEALLACRSYLQKTNQLQEWRTRQTPSDMFFWENPSALRYFQPPRTNTFLTHHTMTTEHPVPATNTLQPIQGTRYFVQLDTTDASSEVTPWPYDVDEAVRNVDDDTVVAEVSMLTVPSSNIDAPQESSDSVWDLEDDPTEDSATTTVVSSTLSLNKLYSLYDDETTEALQHQRRSQATRRRFQNATWKAQWYQRRWGGSDRRRRILSPMDRRARLIPASFLARLAVWEEDQLATAMRNYRFANLRRSRRRRRTNQRRRQFLAAVPSTSPSASLHPATDPSHSTMSRFHYHDDDEISPPKVFSSFLVPQGHQPNPALQALQERRSAQAQRAYQQRVPQSPPKPLLVPNTKVRPPLPGGTLTPKEALMATEQLLQSQSRARLHENSELLCQLLSMVPIILQPTKLSYRKEILCRVLNHVFDLRGKCIPVVSKQDATVTTSYQFMTKASVQVLGTFIMEQIQQRLHELTANQSDPV
jgi:hypothetical protein